MPQGILGHPGQVAQEDAQDVQEGPAGGAPARREQCGKRRHLTLALKQAGAYLDDRAVVAGYGEELVLPHPVRSGEAVVIQIAVQRTHCVQ